MVLTGTPLLGLVYTVEVFGGPPRAWGDGQATGCMTFLLIAITLGAPLVGKVNYFGENHFEQNKALYIQLLPLFHPLTPPTSNTARNLLSRNKDDRNKVRDMEMLSQHTQRNIFTLPYLNSGLADIVSAPRHHLTEDVQNFGNNLFKENSISRIHDCIQR